MKQITPGKDVVTFAAQFLIGSLMMWSGYWPFGVLLYVVTFCAYLEVLVSAIIDAIHDADGEP